MYGRYFNKNPPTQFHKLTIPTTHETIDKTSLLLWYQKITSNSNTTPSNAFHCSYNKVERNSIIYPTRRIVVFLAAYPRWKKKEEKEKEHQRAMRNQRQPAWTDVYAIRRLKRSDARGRNGAGRTLLTPFRGQKCSDGVPTHFREGSFQSET